MVETINELGQLTNTRFGRPRPRHGLKLLYWFANECISFENKEMHCECDPAEGDYGFHCFENRYDKYGNQLLPNEDIPYYVVGNLNSRGANQLPPYVSEDKSDDLVYSNTDRIIVSVDDEWIERVYVTRHIDMSNYDPNATFRISKGLLIIIRSMSLNDLLWKTGYSTWPVQPVLPLDIPVPTTSNIAVVPPAIHPPVQHRPDTSIQIEDPVNNTTKREDSENIPKKGFWDNICTIL